MDLTGFSLFVTAGRPAFARYVELLRQHLNNGKHEIGNEHGHNKKRTADATYGGEKQTGDKDLNGHGHGHSQYYSMVSAISR